MHIAKPAIACEFFVKIFFLGKGEKKIIYLFFGSTSLFHLLPDGTLVECQLLTLQNVSINTTALARAGRDNGVQTTGLELALQGTLNLASGGKSGRLLALHALALLLLGGLGGLLLASSANALTVVGLVPLSERGGVNLHNGRLGEGVGADQFVVGRVIGDDDHADLA